MFKNFSIRIKLLIAFLAVSLIPFGVIGMTALISSSSALSVLAFGQLEGLREVKKAQIMTFFTERRQNMDVLAETVANFQQAAFEKLRSVQEVKQAQIEEYLRQMVSDITVLAEDSNVREVGNFSPVLDGKGGVKQGLYMMYEENYFGNSLRQFKEEYGYADLLLIDTGGNIVYSVSQGSDLGQNLLTGPLQYSSLAQCFNAGLKGVAIQDFAPYPPSDNTYMAFVAAPVVKLNKTVGVAVLKISAAPINTIVQRREGMGETGETYLTAKQEDGYTYRSDRIVKRGNVGGFVSEKHLELAFSGESGSKIKTGEEGELELVTYSPIEFSGLNWVLNTVMSLEEVITPRLSGEEQDYFSKFIEQYGYADLYLIHPQGSLFYSVRNLDEYGTNMLSGRYASSGLGTLVREVLESKAFGFADFQAYSPAGGDPSAFMALPLLSGERVELVVAVRLPIDVINTVMQERSGMGETGETYLVGTDKLMRSDSFLDPEMYSVRNSFANPSDTTIDTEAVRKALLGATGHGILKDYQGNRVLSAYTPVTSWDTTWALIAEMHESEALASVTQVKGIMGVTAITLLAVIVGIALTFSQYIATPIKEVVNTAHSIARGDFSKKLTLQQNDEIGQLVNAFRIMQQAIDDELHELEELLSAVRHGNLERRGNADAFEGSWRELVTGVNDVIEAFMAPFNVTAEYIDRISRGEIPQKITEDYQGDFKEIQQHVNMLIDAMDHTTHVAEAIAGGNLSVEVNPRSSQDRLMMALDNMVRRLNEITTEMRTMIQSVEEGDLEVRGNAGAFEGGWHALIDRMNALLGVLSSAVAHNAAMAQEMALAQKIQTAILPKDITHDDLEIEAIMMPAEEVGGDYYDVLYDEKGDLWLGIGDVSGHGVTPGLIMMMAQTIKTTVVSSLASSPKDVVNIVNKILFKNVHERLQADHFMTFSTLKYLGGGRFQHAGAHLDFIVYRQATDSCELIDTDGTWLNFIPDISHATSNAEFTLDIGDTLVLYSDGLTEAHSPAGGILDIDRFVEIVRSHASKSPVEMRDAILEDTLAWSEQHRADDMSLVIARRMK